MFCDISKAFDRVWHKGLLVKLARIGITGELLEWIESYLSDRKQRVVINGKSSDWGDVKAGVPQGSVLGPLLFLIYINDITFTTENSEIRLFADDTVMYLFVDNPIANAEALNKDLENLSIWATEWLVNFSPAKTKSMIFTRKRKKQHYPPLFMDGQTLDNVESHKHLGVTFSTNLSWNEHIENITVNASRCLDVLNALKYKLDRHTLEKLYVSFIRSKLEYASTVWDNCNQQLKDMVENVQYRAAKIISGATHRTSHKIVYKELGWEYLEERRKKQRLKVFYKIKNKTAPKYLQNIIPPPLAEQNRYELRNDNNYHPPRTRTSAFQNSFLPATLTDWNRLDNDLKSSESIDSFTNMLNKDSIKVPLWFYSGDRFHSIMHARMRMLCSLLNDHLYSLAHVIDSPSCLCGAQRETNKHFLFECPLYVIERNEMLLNLVSIEFKPTLTNLLFGSVKYPAELNISAFMHIQTFIKKTGRFK